VCFILGYATTLIHADDPFNYAELWRSWGAVGREAYLDGVVDGTANAYFKAGNGWLGPDVFHAKPEPDKVRRVRDEVFVRAQRPQIPAVMTDLYADPANAYVSLIDIVFIARDKLEGKDIEKSLQEARKSALDSHRVMERMKRQ
jgi:hypothetical protein